MNGSLSTYVNRSKLTIYERMLCRGAQQCGLHGMLFVHQMLTVDAIRQMGIPRMVIDVNDTNYSSAMADYRRYYRR
jgi:hypothetical protein